MRHWAAMVAALAVAAATGAAAGPVPTESARLGKVRITLHVHPFLNAQELTALRLVMTSEQALAVFVPEAAGATSKVHAAMAVSPDDGFIRGGAPVPSAVALAGLPDAETAAARALAACNAARAGRAPCVLVLEVAPAR